MLDRRDEYIANTPFSSDDTRCAGIRLQLAPEPKDLDIDASIERVFVDPCRVQQVFPAQWALRCVEESGQQRVLALGQRDQRSTGVGQASGTAIEQPAGKPRLPLCLAVALVTSLILRRLLDKTDINRFVWNRALFDLSLLVAITALLVLSLRFGGS